jgi:hypothetical protein
VIADLTFPNQGDHFGCDKPAIVLAMSARFEGSGSAATTAASKAKRSAGYALQESADRTKLIIRPLLVSFFVIVIPVGDWSQCSKEPVGLIIDACGEE